MCRFCSTVSGCLSRRQVPTSCVPLPQILLFFQFQSQHNEIRLFIHAFHTWTLVKRPVSQDQFFQVQWGEFEINISWIKPPNKPQQAPTSPSATTCQSPVVQCCALINLVSFFFNLHLFFPSGHSRFAKSLHVLVPCGERTRYNTLSSIIACLKMCSNEQIAAGQWSLTESQHHLTELLGKVTNTRVGCCSCSRQRMSIFISHCFFFLLHFLFALSSISNTSRQRSW